MISRKHPKQAVARTAFTLMEMLVVVAIIVALAGIGGYYFLGQAQQSRESAARAQMKVVEMAIQTFELKVGRRPANLQELYSSELGGPYLSESRAIQDPWGVPFVYDPNGTNNFQLGGNIKPDLSSVGSGVEIGNWE